MRIGIVCYPTFGGSGVLATELGKALADKGHEVHFITYKQPARLLDSFHERIFYHEVNVSNYPLFDYPPYESALAGRLVDVVQNEKLDLLHLHYAIPHAAAAFMAKQILKQKGITIPYITTLHGTDITLVGKDETFKPLVAFSIEQSDAITTVSEDLKRETIEFFGIQSPIEVIHNFVDLKRFRKHNKEHFRKAIASDKEKIIIHTSNFRKVKRVEDVVHIFNKIQSEIPAKLLFIGDGPERHNVEMLCRNVGILEQVRFLGKQDALEEILAIGDLFLLPSETESFGLSALEAMACMVPVISTNAGGLPEVNIHGKTGYTANVGDIEAMGQFGIELLSNPVLHQQMREDALAQAKTFELKFILPQYTTLYERVLLQNGKTDCFNNCQR
jgi:N-acetyl-alpha-D-glucosaminyl L-malate synthase BshA